MDGTGRGRPAAEPFPFPLLLFDAGCCGCIWGTESLLSLTLSATFCCCGSLADLIVIITVVEIEVKKADLGMVFWDRETLRRGLGSSKANSSSSIEESIDKSVEYEVSSSSVLSSFWLFENFFESFFNSSFIYSKKKHSFKIKSFNTKLMNIYFACIYDTSFLKLQSTEPRFISSI